MKMRRQRLLLLVLFLFALSGEALHTLSAHHDASHCSVCSFQANNVGTDAHTENSIANVYLSHETPQRHNGLSHRFTVTQTLFGRAPPFLHS